MHFYPTVPVLPGCVVQGVQVNHLYKAIQQYSFWPIWLIGRLSRSAGLIKIYTNIVYLNPMGQGYFVWSAILFRASRAISFDRC